jgi:hypothetical protein
MFSLAASRISTRGPVGEICTGFHRRNVKLGIIDQRKFNLLAEIGNVRLRQ